MFWRKEWKLTAILGRLSVAHHYLQRKTLNLVKQGFFRQTPDTADGDYFVYIGGQKVKLIQSCVKFVTSSNIS